MPASRSSLIFPLLKIWSNEALELLGDATCWDDARCPASSAGAAATNPAYAVFQTNGLGSVGVYAYRFDDPGVEDDLMFDVQWPHSIKLGSSVHPHLHWSPADGNAGNVGLGIEWTEANIGETFPVTQLEALAFPTNSSALRHNISEWSAKVKANRNISGMFKARVYRTNAGGIDTYAGNIWIHEFDAHFEIDTLGSRTDDVK